MKLKTRRFHLNPALSPTHYNLCRYLLAQGWGAARFSWLAGFGEQNLCFDESAAQCLEYKHLLAGLINCYSPQAMPETWLIDDQNWPQVLSQLVNKYPLTAHFPLWILKPSLLNNGQHIKLLPSAEAIEQHFLNPYRLGGMHVLQRYIEKPHLLRDDRKYSIRMFVILTNYDGAYLYQQGYYNVAVHRYDANNFKDLRPHLTNEHLHDGEANVLQIPSGRFEQFTACWPAIKAITAGVLQGLKNEFPLAFQCSKQRQIALFGFDFALDNTGRVWLLEANHGPCFPVEDEHPLQAFLYRDFWQAIIQHFIRPIANQAAPGSLQYPGFEKVLS